MDIPTFVANLITEDPDNVGETGDFWVYSKVWGTNHSKIHGPFDSVDKAHDFRDKLHDQQPLFFDRPNKPGNPWSGERRIDNDVYKGHPLRRGERLPWRPRTRDSG